AHIFFPDWERNADNIVATLRTYAGQNPLDKRLTDLIDELVTRSDAFRYRWAKHDVRHHREGLKRIHHPVVGDLELDYHAMDLPANPDWVMIAFTAEPGSVTEERTKLLGSVAIPDDLLSDARPRRTYWFHQQFLIRCTDSWSWKQTAGRQGVCGSVASLTMTWAGQVAWGDGPELATLPGLLGTSQGDARVSSSVAVRPSGPGFPSGGAPPRAIAV